MKILPNIPNYEKYLIDLIKEVNYNTNKNKIYKKGSLKIVWSINEYSWIIKYKNQHIETVMDWEMSREYYNLPRIFNKIKMIDEDKSKTAYGTTILG